MGPGVKPLVGVHRIETVALFPSLFGVKKRQPHGCQPFPPQPGAQKQKTYFRTPFSRASIL